MRLFIVPKGKAGGDVLAAIEESVQAHLDQMFEQDAKHSSIEHGVGRTGIGHGPGESKARATGQLRECEAQMNFHAGRNLDLAMQLVYAKGTDRFGYGTSTVDHLVPGRPSWEGAAECEWNWVFCCAPCSSAKGDWNPDEGTPVGSEDELLGRRKELIALTRAHVHNMLATKHVPDWFRVLGVMEERDTE